MNGLNDWGYLSKSQACQLQSIESLGPHHSKPYHFIFEGQIQSPYELYYHTKCYKVLKRYEKLTQNYHLDNVLREKGVHCNKQEE